MKRYVALSVAAAAVLWFVLTPVQARQGGGIVDQDGAPPRPLLMDSSRP